MTPSNNHPRLTRAPLVEAVFDLRYNTTIPLETVRTGLQKHLPEFKNEERIEGQTFTIQIGPDGKPTSETTDNEELQDIIRYRFRNPETNEFIQLGNGMITFNAVNYSGFDSFFMVLKNVISKHDEIAKPVAYRRLALRYVNHLPLEDTPEKVFASLAPIPQTWGNRVTIQNVQQVALRVGQDLQNVIIAYPQTNLNTGKNIMVLDIDHHLDFALPVFPNVQEIYNWVMQAHLQVYETFRSVLKTDYFEGLK
jgi:uncharacterized protein (TIGR04255 family)